MLISNTTSKNAPSSSASPLMTVVKEGLGIPESSIFFWVSPYSSMKREDWEIEGDVFVVKAASLDMALWRIGGAAVALRLVQVANVSSLSC